MHTINNKNCQLITWKRCLQQPMENCHCKTSHQKQKKGTAHTNYRPVSNLSFISKVVERCTLQQLTQHCNDHTLLPDFQSAYLETSRLWNKPLQINKWHIMGHGKPASNIHDHTRPQCTAFNTVDHELLLKVLNHKLGVTDTALEWYKNYLIPRRLKVSINGSYSSEKTMDFSIPQGSVQGAFLCIAYASAIQEVMKKDLTLTGFMDDHSICKQFKSGTRQEQDTIATLESSLKDIKAWMDAARLKLNESKTEFIYLRQWTAAYKMQWKHNQSHWGNNKQMLNCLIPWRIPRLTTQLQGTY